MEYPWLWIDFTNVFYLDSSFTKKISSGTEAFFVIELYFWPLEKKVPRIFLLLLLLLLLFLLLLLLLLLLILLLLLLLLLISLLLSLSIWGQRTRKKYYFDNLRSRSFFSQTKIIWGQNMALLPREWIFLDLCRIRGHIVILLCLLF